MKLIQSTVSQNKARIFTQFLSLVLLLFLFLIMFGGCITFSFETQVGTANNIEIKFETPTETSVAKAVVASPILSTPLPTLRATKPFSTSTALPIASIPTLGIGSTLIGKDGMTLVYVPAGEFTMGTKAEDAFTECQKYKTSCYFDWSKDEEPSHIVELDAFWIDQTEVTNSMYTRCVDAGKCNPPGSAKILSTNTIYPGYYYYGNPQFENYPVVYVSWSDASTYCEWADRRLPTEAEWEKAARGTDGRTYPWGNDAPNYNILNYDSAVGYTSEVGRYLDGASPYGVLDMAGNVMEWVADWYSESYYVTSPTSNPRGPDAGNYRIVRGGSWKFDWALGIRSSDRTLHSPADYSDGIGFRCAMNSDAPIATSQPAMPSTCDGSSLAFVSTKDGNEEIYIVRLDGTDWINLSQDPANDGHPSWSPDGTKIAFHSNRSGDYEIYIINADGSDVKRLTNRPGWDGNPSWSPDGTKIAYDVSLHGETPEIFVMNTDGETEANLTRGRGGKYPAWSPDGNKLAFEASGQIYSIDADGENILLLTYAFPGNSMPTWSPDGKQIFFSSNQTDNWEIFKVDSDGKNLTRITNNPSDEISPVSFLPGADMIFASNRFGNWDIFQMTADRRSSIRLTNDTGDEKWPVWASCQ